ncbi:MAG: DNRLRE domain-containing protein [Prevotella sp.]|jgi:hypothetical protein|nr:DNRLRE domain-containing protein [Prevotella sp.]
MMKRTVFFIVSLCCSASLSAVNYQLANSRYELNFSTDNNSYELKELSSGAARTFTPTFYVAFKVAKPSVALAVITEDFNYKTVAYGGDLDLFSSNAGAFTLRGTPTSVSESDGVITIVYQDNANYQLTAQIELPAGNEEPVVETSLKALTTGYFSVGFYGAPELDRAETAELFQPLPFTGMRVPESSYLTPAFLATLPGTFLTCGVTTYGVFADPSEFPFSPLPCTLARSPFGVALKNRSGYGKELKPMVWAPVIGNADSQLAVNAVKKFKFRPYVAKGSITAAYEDIARRQFGFGNYRHNDLGSLNKTLDRMLDYAMTTEWGVFKDDLKGCSYDTDVPNSVKNTSALPMYAAAFVADRADVYEKRALPVLEFLLSREDTMYADEETSGAGGQTATNTLGKPCMNYSEMCAFYEITGKRMAAMLAIANANKKNGSLSYEVTLKENFSLYRATQSQSVYSDLITGTDKYLSEEIAVKPTTFSYANHQKNSFWSSIAPKYVELYEIYRITGNADYLNAARTAARIFAEHLWMSPKVVIGDSTTVNIGNKAPRYRGTGQISIPEEKAPNWRLSEMGLHCEAGGTSTGGHRAVFTANSAGYLLRIGSLTKDTFLLDIAKAAVTGRYANFPGYHINTDRTTVYEKPEFPLRTLEQLTSTSMHYSHIWPQINLMLDYLVSDAAIRTKGAVDFPGYYVQNIVHMQNQVYTTGGKFYGDENLTLYMPKDILAPDNQELNFISAYGNGKFYIVFTNQCGQEITTTVRLNASLVNASGKSYAVWKENLPAAGGVVSDNQFEVNVAPHGVTAVALADVPVKTRFQQKLLANTVKNKWNKYYEAAIPVAASKSFLLNPSDSLARLFVFSTSPKGTHTSVKLQYSINKGAWQEIADIAYPFEFSVDVNTGQSIDYKIIEGSSVSDIYTYERPNPSAALSGWTSVNKANGAVLPVVFTDGLPPYEIVYSENGEEKSVSGIEDNPYLLAVHPQTTSYYRLKSVKDGTGASGNVSGDAKVAVTDAFEPVLKYTATQDAQVYKSQPAVNFGSQPQIELKGSATYRRDLFYSFNIPAVTIEANQRAFLNLWINETSRLDEPYLTTLVKAAKFSGDWQENTITWSNQPSMTALLMLDTAAVSYLTTVPGWLRLDVTDLIRQGYTGNLNVKLDYLSGEDVSSIYFAAKEDADAAKRPYFSIADPTGTAVQPSFTNEHLTIVPTLVTNYFEVKGGIPSQIVVFDCTGKERLHLHRQQIVDVSALPAGIYPVALYDAGNRVFRSKIIKATN